MQPAEKSHQVSSVLTSAGCRSTTVHMASLPFSAEHFHQTHMMGRIPECRRHGSNALEWPVIKTPILDKPCAAQVALLSQIFTLNWKESKYNSTGHEICSNGFCYEHTRCNKGGQLVQVRCSLQTGYALHCMLWIPSQRLNVN